MKVLQLRQNLHSRLGNFKIGESCKSFPNYTIIYTTYRKETVTLEFPDIANAVNSDWKIRGYGEEDVGLLPVLLEVMRSKLHPQERVMMYLKLRHQVVYCDHGSRA